MMSGYDNSLRDGKNGGSDGGGNDSDDKNLNFNSNAKEGASGSPEEDVNTLKEGVKIEDTNLKEVEVDDKKIKDEDDVVGCDNSSSHNNNNNNKDGNEKLPPNQTPSPEGVDSDVIMKEADKNEANEGTTKQEEEEEDKNEKVEEEERKDERSSDNSSHIETKSTTKEGEDRKEDEAGGDIEDEADDDTEEGEEEKQEEVNNATAAATTATPPSLPDSQKPDKKRKMRPDYIEEDEANDDAKEEKQEEVNNATAAATTATPPSLPDSKKRDKKRKMRPDDIEEDEANDDAKEEKQDEVNNTTAVATTATPPSSPDSKKRDKKRKMRPDDIEEDEADDDAKEEKQDEVNNTTAVATTATPPSSPDSKKRDKKRKMRPDDIEEDEADDDAKEEKQEEVNNTTAADTATTTTTPPSSPDSKKHDKKLKVRPDDFPKRPLSAHNFFCQENRERVLAERSLSSPQRLEADGEAAKSGTFMVEEIAGLWANLTAEEHERYDQLARDDLQRYRDEVAEYHKSHKIDAAMTTGNDVDDGDNEDGGSDEPEKYEKIDVPSSPSSEKKRKEHTQEDDDNNKQEEDDDNNKNHPPKEKGRLLDVDELIMADRIIFVDKNGDVRPTSNIDNATGKRNNEKEDEGANNNNNDNRDNEDNKDAIVQLLDEEIRTLESTRKSKLQKQLKFVRDVYNNLSAEDRTVLDALDQKRIALGLAPLCSPPPPGFSTKPKRVMLDLSSSTTGTMATAGENGHRHDQEMERLAKSRRISGGGGAGADSSSQRCNENGSLGGSNSTSSTRNFLY